MSFSSRENNKTPKLSTTTLEALGISFKKTVLQHNSAENPIPEHVRDVLMAYGDAEYAALYMLLEIRTRVDETLKITPELVNVRKSFDHELGQLAIKEVSALSPEERQTIANHSMNYAIADYITIAINTKFNVESKNLIANPLQKIRNLADGKLQYAGLESKNIDDFFNVIDSTVEHVVSKHTSRFLQNTKG